MSNASIPETSPKSGIPPRAPVPELISRAQALLGRAQSAADFDHIHDILRPNKPAQSNQATDVAMTNRDVFQLLKQVALQRDANTRAGSMADVKRLLSYFRDEGLDAGQVPTEASFAALLRTPVAHGLILSVANSVGTTVRDMYEAGGLRNLHYPNVYRRVRLQQLAETLFAATSCVPGQERMARTLAVDLAEQLMTPDRKTSARALLHGQAADGLSELARAIAAALEQHAGYKVLHVDCSMYQSSNDHTWTGHAPVWVGAEPGLITSWLFEHPKSVVLFHHADQTRAEVLGQITAALKFGTLQDQYGLPAVERSRATPGQSKTTVSTREALFLFTVTEGAHWLKHPDVDTVLGLGTQRYANLRQALADAKLEGGRGEGLKFDRELLTHLAAHHHVLQPLTWPALWEHAHEQWRTIEEVSKKTLGFPIRPGLGDTTDLTSLALCVAGPEMGVEHASPDRLLNALVGPNKPLLLEHPNLGGSGVSMVLAVSEAARLQWRSIQQRWGSDLRAGSQRYGEQISLDLLIEGPTGYHSSKEVRCEISAVTALPVRRLSDYQGAVGLVTCVPKETLDDVAGHSEVKKFLREVIGYLQTPQRLEGLGVLPPKGVLLYGGPGSGKTMLARAMAGEAGLPIVSVTGPDLMDPENIRRVFALVRRNPSCVVHIDECDTLGKRGHSHAHDLAVNLLLANIDGFATSSTAFFILTTNKTPEAFDDALLRPGRIDTAFEIKPLDESGREHCFKKLWAWLGNDANEYKERVLRLSFGFTGAQIASLVRNVGMRMAREGEAQLCREWVDAELSKLRWGEVGLKDNSFHKERVAVHEAGHALLHHVLLAHVLPIAQVCVAPTHGLSGQLAFGEALAEIAETPFMVRSYISVLLAGRSAECLIFGEGAPSNGAASDLAKATQAAYRAVAYGGLDEEVGALSLAGLDMASKGKAISESLRAQVNERTNAWIVECQNQARCILLEHRKALDALTKALLHHGVLDGASVASLVNSVSTSQPGEDAFHEVRLVA